MNNTEFGIWLPNEAQRKFRAKPIPDAATPQVKLIAVDIDAKGKIMNEYEFPVPIPVRFLKEIVEEAGI